MQYFQQQTLATTFSNKLWLQRHITRVVHTTHTHSIKINSKGQVDTFSKVF